MSLEFTIKKAVPQNTPFSEQIEVLNRNDFIEFAQNLPYGYVLKENGKAYIFAINVSSDGDEYIHLDGMVKSLVCNFFFDEAFILEQAKFPENRRTKELAKLIDSSTFLFAEAY